MLTAFAVLLVMAALLAFLNERYLRFPTTVGVTLAGALASILLFAGALGLDARQLLRQRASILTHAVISILLSPVLIGLAA
ncbi:hypothetical protein DEDE109153_16480 [Deinococcus deserti]|uniref:hypothetical protein n=1 Tax=Deinococcus deserti TaxID=310783 RepID=UPI0006749169|nr:hypothetical protein [Deinococcus deserti]